MAVVSSELIFWSKTKSLKAHQSIANPLFTVYILKDSKLLWFTGSNWCTLRFLLYLLVLLHVLFEFFPDWINYKYWMISIKIHRTVFFYYYTTLPIIRTGSKISLHLQIYVLVDLKNMCWNIYKTSTYNRNLRVIGLAKKNLHQPKTFWDLYNDGAEDSFRHLGVLNKKYPWWSSNYDWHGLFSSEYRFVVPNYNAH